MMQPNYPNLSSHFFPGRDGSKSLGSLLARGWAVLSHARLGIMGILGGGFGLGDPIRRGLTHWAA